MPDMKLSELPRVTDIHTISSDDEMYAVIGGASHAVPFGTISEYVGSRSGFYTVWDFGAAGDGTTDDLAAIQNAIDTAAQNGGGSVLMASGVYAISTPIVPKTGVSLWGTRPAPAFTQACPDQGITLGTGT